MGKVGFYLTNLKIYKKKTLNFINQFYLHQFKNILKYMIFFI